MPIPSPRKGEEQKAFHSRCMGSEVMIQDYPTQKQRNAVCYSAWRKKHGGSAPVQNLREMTREEIAALETEAEGES